MVFKGKQRFVAEEKLAVMKRWEDKGGIPTIEDVPSKYAAKKEYKTPNAN